MTGSLDYDLFVQLYFGLVICVLSAGHALAILTTIQKLAEPKPAIALMTETSLLCDSPADGNRDGSVEHAGYFEDDHNGMGERQFSNQTDGANARSGSNDSSDLMVDQWGPNDDPGGPETDQCNETSV